MGGEGVAAFAPVIAPSTTATPPETRGKPGSDETPPVILETVVATHVLSTFPLHTNSECGKERRILIGP